jgi:hypothetical protein
MQHLTSLDVGVVIPRFPCWESRMELYVSTLRTKYQRMHTVMGWGTETNLFEEHYFSDNSGPPFGANEGILFLWWLFYFSMQPR